MQDCSAILEAIDAAKPNALDLPDSLSHPNAIFELMETAVPFSQRPWKAGYELARYTRSHLGLNGEPISDTAALASVLNQDFDALERATAPVEPLRRLDLVEGVVTSGPSGGVSFGLTEKRDVGRRFLFCRALADAMSFQGDALITRGNTERQQRNRAFAAEFLAPSSSLKKRISHAVLDSEQVDDLAEEFGVSTRVITHQVENHEIAEFA